VVTSLFHSKIGLTTPTVVNALTLKTPLKEECVITLSQCMALLFQKRKFVKISNPKTKDYFEEKALRYLL
jgi:hypothetical protein